MTRSARAALLILALLWQAAVWLTPGGQAQRLTDLSNAMVHGQALAHHHHDDHALHMDDHVTDAAQHQHASETLQWVALVPSLRALRSTSADPSGRPIWRHALPQSSFKGLCARPKLPPPDPGRPTMKV